MKLVFPTCVALPFVLLLTACGSEEATATPGEGVEAASVAQAETSTVDNPLTAWCMETETQEICTCADSVLRDAAAEADYEIYQGLAPTYLERRAAGDGREAAFDAASAEASERLSMSANDLRDVTNRIGRQHRDAIKQCEG